MWQLFEMKSLKAAWETASVAVNDGLILFLRQDFLTLEEVRLRISILTSRLETPGWRLQAGGSRHCTVIINASVKCKVQWQQWMTSTMDELGLLSQGMHWGALALDRHLSGTFGQLDFLTASDFGSKSVLQVLQEECTLIHLLSYVFYAPLWSGFSVLLSCLRNHCDTGQVHDK